MRYATGGQRRESRRHDFWHSSALLTRDLGRLACGRGPFGVWRPVLLDQGHRGLGFSGPGDRVTHELREPLEEYEFLAPRGPRRPIAITCRWESNQASARMLTASCASARSMKEADELGAANFRLSASCSTSSRSISEPAQGRCARRPTPPSTGETASLCRCYRKLEAGQRVTRCQTEGPRPVYRGPSHLADYGVANKLHRIVPAPHSPTGCRP